MIVTAWLFHLDLPARVLARLAGLIDPAERARAAAFRHDLHRDRFIARRGQLRLLISSLAGGQAGALRFGRGPHGKPFLQGRDGPFFNMSSAEALGLCVVCDEADLGCDLTRNVPVPNDLDIASRLFSAVEYRTLFALSGEQRQRAFLKIWTHKEALLKGVGTGLSTPMDSFTTSLLGTTMAVSSVDGDVWSARSVPVHDDYITAVAVRTTRAFELDFMGYFLTP